MAQEKELTLEELKALYAALLKRNEDLETELAEATSLIGELNQQLEDSQAGLEASAVVVVTHEQQQYRVLAPKFNHKGTEYKAEELKKNSALVQELVEAGSGLLHKLEKPKKAQKADKK